MQAFCKFIFVVVLSQRSEALGVCLAVFSVILPYLGKFLKVGFSVLVLLLLFVVDLFYVFGYVLSTRTVWVHLLAVLLNVFIMSVVFTRI